MLKQTTENLFLRMLVSSSRKFSVTGDQNFHERLKMFAWQVHSYGGLEDVQYSTVRVPVLRNPKGLLVKVDAASVNPIDLYMCAGYGKTLINLSRKENELPLTLGRDFCGTVVARGHAADKSYKIGDKVYGFKPINEQGTFSEAIVVDESHVCQKPKHLNHVESASLVYACMTAWSALFLTGGLALKKTTGMRVLVLGASGGVGTAALQLLKSQGCVVSVTCAGDAFPLMKSLGADEVFDYKDSNFCNDVASRGRYHIILDCAKHGVDNIPTLWNYDVYITLNSPLLVNTDKEGLVKGMASSMCTLGKYNLKDFGRRSVRWGFFMPFENGFKFVNNLITEGKICPTVHKTFRASDLPQALKTVSEGHLRGKVVVDFM